jgi:hypothetical protein
VGQPPPPPGGWVGGIFTDINVPPHPPPQKAGVLVQNWSQMLYTGTQKWGREPEIGVENSKLESDVMIEPKNGFLFYA